MLVACPLKTVGELRLPMLLQLISQQSQTRRHALLCLGCILQSGLVVQERSSHVRRVSHADVSYRWATVSRGDHKGLRRGSATTPPMTAKEARMSPIRP
jgi:hypothetical protein